MFTRIRFWLLLVFVALTATVLGQVTVLPGSSDGGSSTPSYYTTVVKAADETVTGSTTLQTDNHLIVPVTSGETYIIEGNLIYSGNNVAADIQWMVGVPGILNDTSANGFYQHITTADAAADVSTLGSGASERWPNLVVSSGTAAAHTAPSQIYFNFSVTPNATGNLVVYFANAGVNAAYETRVHAGSTLRWRQIN